MSPSRPATPVVEYFDDIAADYERWAGATQGKAAARLVAMVEAGRGDRCLDVGTGTGLVARELARAAGRRGEVIGVDASPAMVRRARMLTSQRTVRYQEMWAEDLVFRDGTFDIVTLGDSLAYVADPFRVLEEVRRVLRPTGRIGVSTQARSLATPAQDLSVAVLVDMAREDGLQVPKRPEYVEKLGEPAVLSELLSEHGFRRIRVSQVVTGFRATTPEEWIEMLAGLGPFAHSVLSSMGPARRARLAARLLPEMEALGEDAWRVHHAFTLAVAHRAG